VTTGHLHNSQVVFPSMNEFEDKGVWKGHNVSYLNDGLATTLDIVEGCTSHACLSSGGGGSPVGDLEGAALSDRPCSCGPVRCGKDVSTHNSTEGGRRLRVGDKDGAVGAFGRLCCCRRARHSNNERGRRRRGVGDGALVAILPDAGSHLLHNKLLAAGVSVGHDGASVAGKPLGASLARPVWTVTFDESGADPPLGSGGGGKCCELDCGCCRASASLNVHVHPGVGTQ